MPEYIYSEMPAIRSGLAESLHIRPAGILAGGTGTPAGKTWGTADCDISESSIKTGPEWGRYPMQDRAASVNGREIPAIAVI